jgi:transcriptional regulator of acetoin/glycerol metabolism
MSNDLDLTATASPESRSDAPRPELGRLVSRPGIVAIHPHHDDCGYPVHRISTVSSVGRLHASTVRLDDSTVSRTHARVEPVASGLWVLDLGSSRGTFVDGNRVGSDGALAKFGSLLRFGGRIFLVVGDVEAYRKPLRRLSAPFLGLARDVLAGPVLSEVWDRAARVADLPHPVMIFGESGSGKECVARLLHATRSKKGPFVGLNIAAVPEGLFESELFGHQRGAFTGAMACRQGAFREASGGVLFLDEVADLRTDLQVKLLRAIDLHRVRPVGASSDVDVDVRLVAATSRDLRAMCRDGRFRLDLYYRLTGVVVEVPPLRERRDDVLLLARSILRDEAPGLSLTPEVAEALALARWEGNVRNLRYALAHAIAQAVASGGKQIHLYHLPDLSPVGEQQDVGLTVASIRSAMARANGVASKAATLLGVSRATLYNACRRLGIDVSTLRGPS